LNVLGGHGVLPLTMRPTLALVLVLLAACGPTITAKSTPFEACIESYRIACACESSELVGHGEGVEWVCGLSDEEIEEQCSVLDPAVCDPESAAWDADGCETFHDDGYDQSVSEQQVCYLAELAETCSSQESIATCGE
jgi:hypothetical protein